MAKKKTKKKSDNYTINDGSEPNEYFEKLIRMESESPTSFALISAPMKYALMTYKTLRAQFTRTQAVA